MEYRVKADDMKLLADYQKKLYEKPKLTELFFELTDSCNLNCAH